MQFAVFFLHFWIG